MPIPMLILMLIPMAIADAVAGAGQIDPQRPRPPTEEWPRSGS
jgi:hypothetical protein